LKNFFEKEENLVRRKTCLTNNAYENENIIKEWFVTPHYWRAYSNLKFEMFAVQKNVQFKA
jgi:hypothetical protein